MLLYKLNPNQLSNSGKTWKRSDSSASGQYLLLIFAQLVLLALNIVPDVVFELLPSQLDGAGQGVQLLSREAWDLGQTRVGVKQHGLAVKSAVTGRVILSRGRARANSRPQAMYMWTRWMDRGTWARSVVLIHGRGGMRSSGGDDGIVSRVPGSGE